MPAYVTADLPGTGGAFVGEPECEEVPRAQPGGAGGHLWVKAVKTGIGTKQCRDAIARAVHVPAEKVVTAGNRDRRGRCVQWFSLPADLVEHPQALRTAGTQGKLRVLDVQLAHKAIDVVGIERLRWKARLAGAAAGDGYRRAREILDRLRRDGCPNWVHATALGPDQQLARWGLMLLEGRRLPGAAGAGVTPGRCLFAAQGQLFNRWLARRIEDRLLATAIPGDVVRTAQGEAVVADDLPRWQRRLESWEAHPLGPLFGQGMASAAGDAAAREAEVIAEAGLDDARIARLHGGRRLARVQPGKAMVDIDGGDLVIACELPPEAFLAVVLEEIAKPEGHFG